MDKIPTAESVRFNYRYKIGAKFTGSLHPEQEIEMMIEFAKLHVEAALKEASDKSCNLYCEKEDILNAYPLDLIK